MGGERLSLNETLDLMVKKGESFVVKNEKMSKSMFPFLFPFTIELWDLLSS
jgi:hypothetical protein